MGAIRYLDFNEEAFITDVLNANIIVPGAFSYSDLREMHFDKYERIIKKIHKIAKSLPKPKGVK